MIEEKDLPLDEINKWTEYIDATIATWPCDIRSLETSLEYVEEDVEHSLPSVQYTPFNIEGFIQERLEP